MTAAVRTVLRRCLRLITSTWKKRGDRKGAWRIQIQEEEGQELRSNEMIREGPESILKMNKKIIEKHSKGQHLIDHQGLNLIRLGRRRSGILVIGKANIDTGIKQKKELTNL